MKLGIFYREENENSVASVNAFKKKLLKNNIEYCDLEERKMQEKDLLNVDLLVVFGGDGSVLRASKLVLDTIPIVAMNTGNVGFLTSYEMNEVGSLVQAIENDKLQFSERRMLKIESGKDVFYALNDTVILKNFTADVYSECIKLNLKIDGRFVDKYVADGLVLSTPTGSTAYAISAGGPIATPDLDAIIAAPICAHSLHSRPIVFSSKSKAVVSVVANSKECMLYIDGEPRKTIKPKESVKVYVSDKYVKICDNDCNFFEKLSKKLTSWSMNEAK